MTWLVVMGWFPRLSGGWGREAEGVRAACRAHSTTEEGRKGKALGGLVVLTIAAERRVVVPIEAATGDLGQVKHSTHVLHRVWVVTTELIVGAVDKPIASGKSNHHLLGPIKGPCAGQCELDHLQVRRHVRALERVDAASPVATFGLICRGEQPRERVIRRVAMDEEPFGSVGPNGLAKTSCHVSSFCGSVSTQKRSAICGKGYLQSCGSAYKLAQSLIDKRLHLARRLVV